MQSSRSSVKSTKGKKVAGKTGTGKGQKAKQQRFWSRQAARQHKNEQPFFRNHYMRKVDNQHSTWYIYICIYYYVYIYIYIIFLVLSFFLGGAGFAFVSVSWCIRLAALCMCVAFAFFSCPSAGLRWVFKRKRLSTRSSICS